MDAEELLWLGMATIMVLIFVSMIGYALLVAQPHHSMMTDLCRQADGIPILDDGRYRLCLNSNAIIEIKEPTDAD